MKITKLTTLLFFLQLSMIGIAQSIFLEGEVVDSDGQSIEFASVFIQNSQDPNIQNGIITEADGRFKLKVPKTGSYKISISFIGFQNYEDSLQINQSLNLGQVVLQTAVNELGEVLVTAEKKIMERKEGKLIFNVQNSPLKSGYDGMELLQRTPYLLVDDNGGIVMKNETVTVMINGKISNLSGDALANYLRNITSDQIKSIQVQTHLSANTDAESSGGVVNIILKKKKIGLDGTLRGDHTFRGDGDFTNYNSLVFNYGASKWNVYGTYNFRKQTTLSRNTGGAEYFVSKNLLEEDGTWANDRNRHNYQLGFTTDLSDNQVFGIEGFGTNAGNILTVRNGMVFSNQGDVLDKGQTNLDGIVDSDLYSLTANYAITIDTFNSSIKLFADYATQGLTNKNNVNSFYELAFFQDNLERNTTQNRTDIYAFQADLEKYLKHKIKLSLGTKYTATVRENRLLVESNVNDIWTETSRTSSFDYNENVWAAYLSANKKIGTHFFEAGLRLENTDLKRTDYTQDTIIQQNYTDLFPNLYYSKDLKNNNLFSFSYSRRLRRPSFQFLNNYVIKINDFRYELGNPDLRPEYVNNFELGFSQKKQSVEVYYQKTNEAINGIYYLEGEVSFYQKFNAGSQTQVGVSYNRFGNLLPWWYIKASTGVYNRKFTDEDGTDSFKRTTGYVDVTNNFKLGPTTNLELSGWYRSKLEDAYYIAFPAYRMDIMIQQTFLNKRLMARIYLLDIFDSILYENERPFDTFTSRRIHDPQSQRLSLWLVYNFSGSGGKNRKNRSKNEARRRL